MDLKTFNNLIQFNEYNNVKFLYLIIIIIPLIMKITTTQRIGIPILSLLLAFSILAFQHHENRSESTHLDKNKSSVMESHSLNKETLTGDRNNDSSSN